MGRELIFLLAVLQISLVAEGLNHGKVDVPNYHQPFGPILVIDVE